MAPRFEILPADALVVHEETDPSRLDDLVDRIAEDGYILEPIVVDDEHRIILDGHHRYGALRRLDCERIPVYLVDYDSPTVEVRLWYDAPATSITKEEVVERAGSGKPYPPKTTRHVFEDEMPERKVPLEKLRDG